MAARNFGNEVKSAVPRTKELVLEAVGGGAAANCTITHGLGVASCNYNAATGKYRITLSDLWKYAWPVFTVIDPASGIDDWSVVVEAVTLASKQIDIAVFKGGALADMATDEKLIMRCLVTDSDFKPLKGS